MTLILRGHHLLCLQGFQGYGYNEEFTENMTNVHEKLKTNVKIKVIAEADDLCKACPNLKNDICIDLKENQNIVLSDEKIMEKLPKKDTFDSKELFEIINSEFDTLESIKDICHECKWWNVCLFVKNLENR